MINGVSCPAEIMPSPFNITELIENINSLSFH